MSYAPREAIAGEKEPIVMGPAWKNPLLFQWPVGVGMGAHGLGRLSCSLSFLGPRIDEGFL